MTVLDFVTYFLNIDSFDQQHVAATLEDLIEIFFPEAAEAKKGLKNKRDEKIKRFSSSLPSSSY